MDFKNPFLIFNTTIMENEDINEMTPALVDEMKARINSSGKTFLLVDEETEENSEEYAHFNFIGKHEGKEVVFDAVMYTLRLQHESELFEIAEHRAAKHFPQYKKINYEEDENGNMSTGRSGRRDWIVHG